MISSDFITTYIGTYTRRESFVDGKAEGIYIYRLDLRSGGLTHTATVTGEGAVNPSYLAFGPSKRYLYAVNEITRGAGPHGTVSAFAVDPVTGGLRYLNQQSTVGLSPCYVSVEPEGRYCLAANYESGSVSVLPIREDGSLGETTDTIQFSGSGPNVERQEGPHAHMIAPAPYDRLILTIDLGADRLMAFYLDLERGRLSPAASAWTQFPPGAGPRHLAFHPRQPFVYVINELQSTVTVFQYLGISRLRREKSTIWGSARNAAAQRPPNTEEIPPATEEPYQEGQSLFKRVQVISTLPTDFTGQNLGAAIRVAPSGRFVYASNRGHNSLAIYAADPETGRLSLIGHQPTQGAAPRDFNIDPTGALLLVANQDSDTLVTFWIDPDSGTLRAAGSVATPTPVCIQLADA